jgi:2-oxoglutarate ferredoxin oxidoreductase subunit beta
MGGTMVTTATPTQEPKTVAHYRSGLRPIWCAGCGDFGVLAAFYEALVALDIDKDNLCVISGIGCSSRFPGFVDAYGYHGLHGRSLPVATGVKMARPEQTVVAFGGEGV